MFVFPFLEKYDSGLPKKTQRYICASSSLCTFILSLIKALQGSYTNMIESITSSLDWVCKRPTLNASYKMLLFLNEGYYKNGMWRAIC